MDFAKLGRWLTLPAGIAAAALTLAQVFPEALIWRFNPYALLSAAGLAAMAIIFAIVRNLKTRNAVTITFSLFMTALIFWGTGEMFQRLSATPQGALFWNQAVFVGMVLLPSTFYFFARSYIKKDNYAANPTAIYFIGTTALIFIYLMLTTDAIIRKDASGLHSTFWGYANHVNELGFLIFVGWLEIILIGSIISLVKFRRQSTRPHERSQTAWFIAAMVIPVTGGSLTEGVLPLLDYHALPMTLILTTISAVVVIAAMKRYQLFILNPATIAENILATMAESVMVAGADAKIEYVNEAAEAMTGSAKENLLDRPIGELFAGGLNLTFHNADFLRFDKLRLIQQSGYQMFVSVSAARVRDSSGVTSGYIVVATDVSKLEESYQRLQEKIAEIEQVNQSLADLGRQLGQEKSSVEKKVAERTKQLAESKLKLEAQNIRLKKLDEAKTVFLSVASHQLRTPITIALLAVSILTDPRSGALSPSQQKTAAELKSSIERMSRLINDLLNITRLEQGRINYRPQTFPLREFVTKVVGEFMPRLLASHLHPTVDIATDWAITADPYLMKEILSNLLDNAVKYNRPGGSVKIHAVEDGGFTTIVVHDTGLGMNKEDLAQVGQQFYRSKSAIAADPNGTGLGLFVVKNLAALHQGKVTIESVEGRGTSVAVTLPPNPPRALSAGDHVWTNQPSIDI